MPRIDMAGLDTQHAPMYAVEDVVNDCHGGFISPLEAVEIINAIVCEWRQ